MVDLALVQDKKENYFTIRMNDESFYLCHVVDSDVVFTVDTVEGVDVITESRLHDYKTLKLRDVFVIVATPDGPIPVEYAKMPGGSKVLWVNVDNVCSFNVIDQNSKLVAALDQILSGIVTDVTPAQQQAARQRGR
jgi:hypothetical protein